MSTLLAIDPGYDRCGVALIDITESPTLVKSWCITTNKKDTHGARIAQIFTELQASVTEHHPVAIALETLFFSVNKKSVMAVAEARGVISLIAGLYNIALVELSPQEVKLGMTGSGNADKKMVQKMVELTLKIDTSTKLDDEIDAIALGMAAAGVVRMKTFS